LAVADDLGVAGCEPRQDDLALVLGRGAVEVFGAHASLNELIADVDAVTDAAGKCDSAPALAVLVPVRDDVADELVAIHPLGKLRLDIVTGLRPDAAQIWIDRRIDARPDEVALLDQVGDLRAFDHALEDAAEPSIIATARRCGQSEHDGVGICLDHLLVRHRAGVVRLVNDQEIG
jgi:hypothetical protein